MADRDSIIAALTGEASPLRAQAAQLLVEHVLSQRVDELIAPEQIAPLLVQALHEENLERALQRHVLPGIERVRERLVQAGERLGDPVPEAARAELVALFSNPDGPRLRWLRGALDRETLRKLLAPVLQEVLLQFAGGLGIASAAAPRDARGTPGGGLGAGGLVGRLGRGVSRSTERLMNVGKSVADGLGVDLEGRFKEAAREFSQGALGGLQAALAKRLKSPEGRALSSELSRGALQHILATPFEAVQEDLDRIPLPRALALVPPITAQALAREVGRACLETELQAWLALEGERSLRELLDEAGLLPQVRAMAIARTEQHAQTLFGSVGFRDWLDDLLTR